MKKKLLIALSLIFAVCASCFVLNACSGSDEVAHEFSDQFSSDTTHHWHDSIDGSLGVDGFPLKGDYAEHEFSDWYLVDCMEDYEDYEDSCTMANRLIGLR